MTLPAPNGDTESRKTDPTVLTDKAIAKETIARQDAIDAIRSELSLRKELLETRIDAAEHLAQERTRHQREVSDIRFLGAEKLTAQGDDLRATALTAAFAAQKESAAKTETGTAEALDKLGVLFATTIAGLASKVEDVKDRVGRIESVATGAIAQRTEGRLGGADNRGWVAAAIGLAGFVILLLDRFGKVT